MKIVDTVSQSMNYGITSVDHAVKKVVTNPGTLKKVLQITLKTFELIDLCCDREFQNGEVKHIMKGTTELIGFYSTYKNLMYWLNLFSKETLDQEVLQNSISESLLSSDKDSEKVEELNKLATEIFTEVMKEKAYHSKDEVLKKIEAVLIKHDYEAQKAKEIASKIIVQQKKRPTVELFYMTCFTAAELGGNLLNLQKWHVLEISKIAASIGGQSRVFMFVADLGAGFTIGVIASAGLALVVLETSYETAILAMKYGSVTDKKEKEEAYKELTKALFDLTVNTADFAATAAPMVFALSPATVVGLALFSKGVGLVRILAR